MKQALHFRIIIFFIAFNLYGQRDSYDFSCYEEDLVDFFIGTTSEAEKAVLNSLNVKVSLEDEEMIGKQLILEQKKKYKFVTTGKEYETLYKITDKLSKNIKNPRGFNYEIFYLESNDIFAYTAGGKIFYSTGLFKFSNDTSIIASIIGHEMAHNELKHINDILKRHLVAKKFSSIGEIIGNIASIITVSLNQKDEIHCDFYGVDLAFQSGYKPFQLPSFWDRISKKTSFTEGAFKFISSHPSPKKRKDCINNHIITFYKN